MKKHLWRLAVLVLLSFAALQIAFALRIAAMRFVDPQSTTFQRSEAWRLLVEKHRIAWSQEWVPMERISPQLGRAVIASEDAGFIEHPGFDWEAIDGAWRRNQRQQQLAPRRVRVFGGSTITQQLAKNLLLSGERTVLRKGQELAIALLLEALLPKQRILEIYLNNVEWGEGVFGAQAAAKHYFRGDAARLSAMQSARLAAMLPAPKRFEKQVWAGYMSARTATIAARMPAVELP